MSGAAKKAIQTVTVGVFFFLTFYAYAHHLTKIVTPDFFPIGQKLPPLFLSTVMLFVPPMLFLVIVAGRMIERTAGGPASFWTARVSGRAAWVVLVAIALPIFPTIVVFQSLVEPIVLPLMAAVVVASYLLKNWRPFPAIYPFVFFLALTTFLYRSVDQARPRTERIYRKTLNQQGVVPIATYSWGEPTVARMPDAAATCPVHVIREGPIKFPPHYLYYLAADPTGRYIYATDKMESPEDPSLYRFSLFFRYDTAADRLDALPLPERTQAVTYDAETGVLWVGNVAGSRLFRIRADAFDHQLEFTCEMVARNSDPSCVCPDDAGDLYAEYPAHRDVQDVIIERDKNRMLVFYETPSDELAWRSLPHEATIWQLEPMKMIKQVFNPSADFVRRSAKTGHYYTQVDWIPPGVAELDQDTLQIRRTLMWPFGFGLDVDPATGDLFLVNPVTGRLYRIDPVGLKVVDSMKIGIGLKSVTVDSGRGLLYVGNYFTGDFYVVSWNDKKVLATANVGQRNYATLVVPESGRVFTTTTYGFFEIKVDELIARGTADE